MRPRGMPPPSAMSRVIAPEGKVATLACDASPSFMMDPLPKLASISPSTRSRAFFLASLTAISSGVMAGLASSALDALGSAEALALTAGFLAAALVDDPLVATVFAADCARSLAATEDLGAPAEEEVLKLADPPVRDESSPVPLLAVDATIAAGVRRWIARLATLRPWIIGKGAGGRWVVSSGRRHVARLFFQRSPKNLRCQAVISRGARVTEAHLLGERAVGEAGGERDARHCRNGLNNLSSTIHPRLGKWSPGLSRGFWRANSAPQLAKRRFPTLGKPKITKHAVERHAARG